MTVNDAQGTADVPIEVRVAPDYQGPLTLKATLNGQTAEQKLTIDPHPVNAIGISCQPSTAVLDSTFNINLWYTQTHARASDIIAVCLDGNTKQYYGGCKVSSTWTFLKTCEIVKPILFTFFSLYIPLSILIYFYIFCLSCN